MVFKLSMVIESTIVAPCLRISSRARAKTATTSESVDWVSYAWRSTPIRAPRRPSRTSDAA
jgi:hypothetical protein